MSRDQKGESSEQKEYIGTLLFNWWAKCKSGGSEYINKESTFLKVRIIKFKELKQGWVRPKSFYMLSVHQQGTHHFLSWQS